MKNSLYGFARRTSAMVAMGITIAMNGAPARAEGQPFNARGTIVSLVGSKLVVHPKSGADMTIVLADAFNAIAVVKSSMADIKKGAFIGTATATQPDSSLRSVEVVVFPEGMRGVAEGHYPWDLPGANMMTNATVSNAVEGVDGQTVTVTYKGGEKKIDIPAKVPVVTLVPSTAADLHAGEIVFVPSQRQADGSLHAGVVVFGKDGVTPPM